MFQGKPHIPVILQTLSSRQVCNLYNKRACSHAADPSNANMLEQKGLQLHVRAMWVWCFTMELCQSSSCSQNLSWVAFQIGNLSCLTHLLDL